jgi:hypothetical protein
VAAAGQRTDRAVPKIAVVTASAFDPFDPVDFYLDALREAGAEVEWWPLDAALATAVFERRDCAALPALRLEMLKLPARERIYPDLVAQQQRACEAPEALAAVPQRVQGVFFAGGDQWKLRRAFFDREDRPNAWLQALREAVAKGGVVIGGTSAGSAVQSGGPMLSNGTSEEALKHGAIASPPPAAGCARSGDCIGGLDEDAFTYWPAGGLGLAPEMIVDTHFSERARELRLLRLLADTGTRIGIGADETSALHLRWRDDGGIDVRALGASGGWLFDLAPGCVGDGLQAQAHYLAPGPWLHWRRQGVSVDAMAMNDGIESTHTDSIHPDNTTRAGDALARGALRTAAQRLASDGVRTAAQRLASDGVRTPLSASDVPVRIEATGASRVWRNPQGLSGITAMRIEMTPWRGCR